ncbi:MAG: hypothetical protein LLF94_08425, partial [Chlamydiales bacterium]|nr:hypothetical protein [Chlamydiales bacterium]
LQQLLNTTHWDFTPLQHWDEITGRKWIIVSPSDEVIDNDTASFCQGVLKRHPEQLDGVIRLPELHSLMHNGAPEGHNVPLVCKEYSTSWQKHIEFIHACFKDLSELR